MNIQSRNHNGYSVVYWDSSGILSALFEDAHSKKVLAWLKKKGIHLISSLGYAEVCAVMSRLRREKKLSNVFLDAALDTLTTGPLRHLNIQPDRRKIISLSERWPLRGADLWHLSAAKTFAAQIPEMILLTLDERMRTAAEGEGLVVVP
jgi:predicted nucleic acid-binding protein